MTTESKKAASKPDAAKEPAKKRATAGKTPAKKTPAKKKKKGKKEPPPKEPKKPGRKPWVPDYDKIMDWARQGLKDHEIAALCGITKQVFCTKKNELDEHNEPSRLFLVLAEGRAKGISMATTALWKNIALGDTQSIKFFLERAGGWKQHVVNEEKKRIEDLTDEELQEILEKLEAGE